MRVCDGVMTCVEGQSCAGCRVVPPRNRTYTRSWLSNNVELSIQGYLLWLNKIGNYVLEDLFRKSVVPLLLHTTQLPNGFVTEVAVEQQPHTALPNSNSPTPTHPLHRRQNHTG